MWFNDCTLAEPDQIVKANPVLYYGVLVANVGKTCNSQLNCPTALRRWYGVPIHVRMMKFGIQLSNGPYPHEVISFACARGNSVLSFIVVEK